MTRLMWFSKYWGAVMQDPPNERRITAEHSVLRIRRGRLLIGWVIKHRLKRSEARFTAEVWSLTRAPLDALLFELRLEGWEIDNG